MQSHHLRPLRAFAAGLALFSPAALAPAIAEGAAASERLLDGGFDDPALSSWQLEIFDTSTLEWVAVDATESPSSGSLRARKKVGENPNSVRVSQCFPLGPGPIELSGRFLVPFLDEAHRPLLSLSLHDEPDCGGDVANVFASLSPTSAGVWTPAGPFVDEAPEGTRSAELLAGIIAFIEPGSLDVYEVSWDDLSVVPEPASGTGAVAGLTLGALARRRRGAAARRTGARAR